jgi:hypothetical protein
MLMFSMALAAAVAALTLVPSYSREESTQRDASTEVGFLVSSEWLAGANDVSLEPYFALVNLARP